MDTASDSKKHSEKDLKKGKKAKVVALKEMEGDKTIQGMLNHYSIKEIMTLRKLSHPNIASAESVHFNHNLYDFSKFDPNKKNFKMYI